MEEVKKDLETKIYRLMKKRNEPLTTQRITDNVGKNDIKKVNRCLENMKNIEKFKYTTKLEEAEWELDQDPV